jgi:hypothetical protein
MTKELSTNKVPQALQAIEAKLNGLKMIEDSVYKTSCEFRWNPNYQSNPPIKLDAIVDVDKLIQIHSYIAMKDEAYNKSANTLEITEYPVFKWQGYTLADWEHDIKLRIAIVTHKTQFDKLKRAKNKLESFLSKEQQVEMFLEQLGLDL